MRDSRWSVAPPTTDIVESPRTVEELDASYVVRATIIARGTSRDCEEEPIVTYRPRVRTPEDRVVGGAFGHRTVRGGMIAIDIYAPPAPSAQADSHEMNDLRRIVERVARDLSQAGHPVEAAYFRRKRR